MDGSLIKQDILQSLVTDEMVYESVGNDLTDSAPYSSGTNPENAFDLKLEDLMENSIKLEMNVEIQNKEMGHGFIEPSSRMIDLSNCDPIVIAPRDDNFGKCELYSPSGYHQEGINQEITTPAVEQEIMDVVIKEEIIKDGTDEEMDDQQIRGEIQHCDGHIKLEDDINSPWVDNPKESVKMKAQSALMNKMSEDRHQDLPIKSESILAEDTQPGLCAPNLMDLHSGEMGIIQTDTGVWSTRFLPKGTKFGLYDCSTVSSDSLAKGFDWTSLLRKSGGDIIHNTVAKIDGSQIFYNIVTDIQPQTELILLELEPTNNIDDTDTHSAISVTTKQKHSATKSHQCIECGKTFTQKHVLTRHILIHSGKKTHQCIECEKTFTQKSSLVRHMHIHTEEKPHQCIECGNRFTQKYNLVTHMRTHTGEKPHECKQCGKFFSQPGTLKQHMNTHMKEKPFQCIECGSQFTQKQSLIRHMFTHSGEKPHQCEQCGKFFSHPGRFKTHIEQEVMGEGSADKAEITEEICNEETGSPPESKPQSGGRKYRSTKKLKVKMERFKCPVQKTEHSEDATSTKAISESSEKLEDGSPIQHREKEGDPEKETSQVRDDAKSPQKGNRGATRGRKNTKKAESLMKVEESESETPANQANGSVNSDEVVRDAVPEIKKSPVVSPKPKAGRKKKNSGNIQANIKQDVCPATASETESPGKTKSTVKFSDGETTTSPAKQTANRRGRSCKQAVKTAGVDEHKVKIAGGMKQKTKADETGGGSDHSPEKQVGTSTEKSHGRKGKQTRNKQAEKSPERNEEVKLKLKPEIISSPETEDPKPVKRRGRKPKQDPESETKLKVVEKPDRDGIPDHEDHEQAGAKSEKSEQISGGEEHEEGGKTNPEDEETSQVRDDAKSPQKGNRGATRGRKNTKKAESLKKVEESKSETPANQANGSVNSDEVVRDAVPEIKKSPVVSPKPKAGRKKKNSGKIQANIKEDVCPATASETESPGKTKSTVKFSDGETTTSPAKQTANRRGRSCEQAVKTAGVDEHKVKIAGGMKQKTKADETGGGSDHSPEKQVETSTEKSHGRKGKQTRNKQAEKSPERNKEVKLKLKPEIISSPETEDPKPVKRRGRKPKQDPESETKLKVVEKPDRDGIPDHEDHEQAGAKSEKSEQISGGEEHEEGGKTNPEDEETSQVRDDAKSPQKGNQGATRGRKNTKKAESLMKVEESKSETPANQANGSVNSDEVVRDAVPEIKKSPVVSPKPKAGRKKKNSGKIQANIKQDVCPATASETESPGKTKSTVKFSDGETTTSPAKQTANRRGRSCKQAVKTAGVDEHKVKIAGGMKQKTKADETGGGSDHSPEKQVETSTEKSHGRKGKQTRNKQAEKSPERNEEVKLKLKPEIISSPETEDPKPVKRHGRKPKQDPESETKLKVVEKPDRDGIPDHEDHEQAGAKSEKSEQISGGEEHEEGGKTNPEDKETSQVRDDAKSPQKGNRGATRGRKNTKKAESLKEVEESKSETPANQANGSVNSDEVVRDAVPEIKKSPVVSPKPEAGRKKKNSGNIQANIKEDVCPATASETESPGKTKSTLKFSDGETTTSPAKQTANRRGRSCKQAVKTAGVDEHKVKIAGGMKQKTKADETGGGSDHSPEKQVGTSTEKSHGRKGKQTRNKQAEKSPERNEEVELKLKPEIISSPETEDPKPVKRRGRKPKQDPESETKLKVVEKPDRDGIPDHEDHEHAGAKSEKSEQISGGEEHEEGGKTNPEDEETSQVRDDAKSPQKGNRGATRGRKNTKKAESLKKVEESKSETPANQANGSVNSDEVVRDVVPEIKKSPVVSPKPKAGRKKKNSGKIQANIKEDVCPATASETESPGKTKSTVKFSDGETTTSPAKQTANRRGRSCKQAVKTAGVDEHKVKIAGGMKQKTKADETGGGSDHSPEKQVGTSTEKSHGRKGKQTRNKQAEKSPERNEEVKLKPEIISSPETEDPKPVKRRGRKPKQDPESEIKLKVVEKPDRDGIPDHEDHEQAGAKSEKSEQISGGEEHEEGGKTNPEDEDIKVRGHAAKKRGAGKKPEKATTSTSEQTTDDEPASKKGRDCKSREDMSPDLQLQADRLKKTQTKGHKFIGAHVSIAGGLHKSVLEAVEIGARAFGFFLKSQRQWASKPLDEEVARKFKRTMKEYDISPAMVVPHGSYLMNLGSQEKELLQKSRAMLVDELQRCEKLDLPIFNFHPGSTCGQINKEDCIKRISESINQALDKTTRVTAVIENMCGQRNTIGGPFSEIRDIIAGVHKKSRVGVCLDTCHAFAAGYDVSTAQGYQQTMSDFNKIVGLKYLRAIHVNDSMGELGCHKDRHENIGKGKIGLKGFRHFMNDPRLDNIPFILETPENDYTAEIRTLNSLIK